jgi:hypothetical protein
LSNAQHRPLPEGSQFRFPFRQEITPRAEFYVFAHDAPPEEKLRPYLKIQLDAVPVVELQSGNFVVCYRPKDSETPQGVEAPIAEVVFVPLDEFLGLTQDPFNDTSTTSYVLHERANPTPRKASR